MSSEDIILENELQSIFNEIQNTNLIKKSQKLEKAYKIILLDNNSFNDIVDYLLLCNKSTIPFKLSDFFKKLIEKFYSENNIIFIKNLLNYLIEFTSSKSIKARKNSLQLINIILEIVKIDYLTIENLQSIAERLFDKEKTVRKEAVKICIKYQNCKITESLTIQSTLKDVVRHDTFDEIRKISLIGIEINQNTINCILERSMDTNSNIRKVFWVKMQQFNLRDFPDHQRIYLMKRAFLERDFDAKSIFMTFIKQFTIEEFIELFYCKEPEYIECINTFLINSEQIFLLDNFSPIYTNFINIYYKFVENTFGRDSLKLMPLKDFLEILQKYCISKNEIDNENISNIKNDKNSFEGNPEVIKNLFKLLEFYDIFTIEDKSMILSLIKDLVIKIGIKEIVEESIIFVKRICPEKLISFISSTIKRTIKTPISLIIGEFAMKHVDIYESERNLHDAIITEIAILEPEKSLNIFYWYLMKKFSNEIFEIYFQYSKENFSVIEGCVDLVLLKKLDISKIEFIFEENDENLILSKTKLILSGFLNDEKIEKIIKSLLVNFYTTNNDSIQQYLSIFFFEYFRNNSIILANIFIDVLNLISLNHKIFIDQSIYWISNDKNFSNSLSKLCLNISIYILNFDQFIIRKWLFETLRKIDFESEWEHLKQIIYIFGNIVRKNYKSDSADILQRLMAIDDGEPLNEKELVDVKELIEMNKNLL